MGILYFHDHSGMKIDTKTSGQFSRMTKTSDSIQFWVPDDR